MSRVTFDKDGGLSFRTKLMTFAAARRFGRCMEANARFERVDVVASPTAKGEKSHFVTFRPANRERVADIYEGQQANRTFAGYTEGMEYYFVQDTDDLGLWWCLSVSGETYEVRPGSCSCPDFAYRCKKAGLRCKHAEAYDAQRRAGVIGRPFAVSIAA